MRAVREVGRGPVTGLPLRSRSPPATTSTTPSSTSCAGRSTCSTAKPIRPDSGDLDAVRGRRGPGRPTTSHYWHPDGPPPASRRTCRTPVRLPERARAARRAAARRSTPPGCGMPWYSVFGNHDGLVQGNVPARPADRAAGDRAGRRSSTCRPAPNIIQLALGLLAQRPARRSQTLFSGPSAAGDPRPEPAAADPAGDHRRALQHHAARRTGTATRRGTSPPATPTTPSTRGGCAASSLDTVNPTAAPRARSTRPSWPG